MGAHYATLVGGGGGGRGAYSFLACLATIRGRGGGGVLTRCLHSSLTFTSHPLEGGEPFGCSLRVVSGGGRTYLMLALLVYPSTTRLLETEHRSYSYPNISNVWAFITFFSSYYIKTNLILRLFLFRLL